MMAPRWLLDGRTTVLVLMVSVSLATGLKFDAAVRDFEVNSGAPPGTVVGRLRANSGAGVVEDLIYSLHNTSDHAYFQLDSRTGLLSTTRTIDREVNSTYHIIARVSSVRSKTTEHGRFVIRVSPPARPTDAARLTFDQEEYRGVVEADSPAGVPVISTLALVTNDDGSTGNVTYFIQPDDGTNSSAADWFKMDPQTGTLTLLKDQAVRGRQEDASRNVSFIVGANRTLTGGKALSARAKALVTIHGMPRPRDLTVAKLSADAAVVCWKFPASAGAQGYRLRYWIQDGGTDDDESLPSSSSAAPLELRITDTADSSESPFGTKDLKKDGSRIDKGLRDICAHLKQLDAAAPYKVQISAWKQGRPGDEEIVGPPSANLHFTTQTNVCLLNGTCETGECQISLEPPGYECLCHSGHYGDRCEHFDPCIRTPCLNGATCVAVATNSSDLLEDGFLCQCADGWMGEDCSVATGCPGTCLNNGTCSMERQPGKCICQPGYEGAQCQDFNPCHSGPCLNGATCAKSPDGSPEFICHCPLGYRGPDCGEAIDYCVLEPCRNGGSCSSKDGSYHCQCPSGFQGVDCEQDVDECLSNPCHNSGTCLNLEGSFLCVCPPEFVGSRCENDANDCLSSPCRNKAVCEDKPGLGNYTCHCRPGFAGRDCETDLDDCDPDPCLNGGTCIDQVNAFACRCRPGFRGLRCDQGEKCPAEEQVIPTRGTFRWPTVEHGRTVMLDCPFSNSRTHRKAPLNVRSERSETYLRRQERLKRGPNGTFYAVRSCELQADGSARWMDPDVSLCKKQDAMEAESKSSMLEEQTIKPMNLTPSLLDQVADEVANLVDFAVVDPIVAKNMFNSLSNVLEQADEDVLSASTDSCDRLLEAVDRYASNVRLVPGQSLKLATPNIVVEAVLLNSTGSPYSFRPTFANASITLPKEAIDGSEDGPVRLKFVSYRTGKLFQQRGTGSRGDPGVVLVASVDQRANVSGLVNPVTYTVPRETGSSFYSCVYWDEENKEWSTKGIKTSWSVESGSIQCESDHMTAFSVLLDPTPYEQLSELHQYILKVISYVGSGLSILGLSITVILYSLFRNLRRDRGGKILLNLCISLLLLNVVFLVGSVLGSAFGHPPPSSSPERIWLPKEEEEESGEDQKSEKTSFSMAHIDVCTGISMAGHYFVLSSLFWMMVEAVHMYQLLITVFANSETFFMLKRILTAWGIPVLVVVPTAILFTDYYRDPSGLTCGRMSVDQPAVYYASFIGPSCLALLINTAVFFMVLRVILMQGQRGKAVGKVPASEASSSNGHGSAIHGGSSAKVRRLVSMAQLRGAVTVMALLGVTWLAGALAIGPAKLVMSYIFCVCNSLQGFVIFIVRVVQYPEARLSWITLWNTGQTHIPYDVTRLSTGPTTNSSGSGHQNLHNQKSLNTTVAGQSIKSRKINGSSKSPSIRAAGLALGHHRDNSLTPSQAPTLPMPGDPEGSLSLSYKHWFPASTNNGSATGPASPPSSNGSHQSRFRRIFGQLGLEPSSFRLSGKSSSNGSNASSRKKAQQQHALLERHVSGATNPPPSPGETNHRQIDALPDDLIKPNFLIGEEISLLHRNGSLHSLENTKEPWSSGIGREGANTSWTFLRPDFDEPGDPPQHPYQSGKGSVPILSVIGSKHHQGDRHHPITPARRTASFAMTSQMNPDGWYGGDEARRSSSPPRRTTSLCGDASTAEDAHPAEQPPTLELDNHLIPESEQKKAEDH